ncbi:unnamed protein product [Phaedon cochleariae]|uniref:Endonuclease-reverse transcriptase n=1 Tax=Phaedon cochleariae TaxID=80249 RepID=A0A9N9SL82_PHACE|nr:unnamed protein product [Phaedon cochleariae]
MMDEDTKQILQKIIEQNNEIRDDIRSIRTEISLSLDRTKKLEDQVDELTTENKELRKSNEYLSRKLKDNNLIIFGIEEEETLTPIDAIQRLVEGNLKVSLREFDVNNTFRIGQKTANKIRPIILQLTRNIKKQEILQNAAKLKGTGISVSHDLTPTEREEKQVLFKYYKEAKNKKYDTTLLRNKVIINGEVYTAGDLSEGLHERVSAPEVREKRKFSSPDETETEVIGNSQEQHSEKRNPYSTRTQNRITQSNDSEKSLIIPSYKRPKK